MKAYLVSTCLAALAAGIVPVVAYATEADQPQSEQTAENEQSGIQDIVVTAQRRAENLQNVPIAITALNTEQLAKSGVTDTATLQTAVTGLAFNSSLGVNGQPRLRGIGTTANGPGIENPVATYIDGVYLASTATTLISLTDVAQVAVLKGPQGTLFGRNATGGLVQITTRTPTQDFKLNASGTIKNRDGQAASLYMAGGLTDGLAASIAANYDRLGDGFGINQFDGTPTYDHNAFSVRGKIVWKPGEDTTVTFSGDYSFYKGSDFSPRPIRGFNVFGEVIGGSVWDVRANYTSESIARQGGGSLKIQQDLGGVEVMSLTAYRKARFTQTYDQDLSAAPPTVNQNDFFAQQTDKQFSQEVQLLSTGNGPFKWVVGGIYFHGNGFMNPTRVGSTRPLPPATVTVIARQKLYSFAGFAQGSYSFDQGTTVTAGLRFTSDKRDVATNITRVPFPGTLANYAAEKRFEKLTWRLSVDHRVSPELLVYGSYNRGFKSGSFVPTAPLRTEVKPETLDAFEAGFKADLFDRKVRLNGSAYYYDYQNTQVTTIATGLIRLFNASGSRHHGFELDATFQPTDNFNFNAGIGYVKAKFKAFPNAPRSIPLSPTPGVTLPALGQGGNRITAYDATQPTNTSVNINAAQCFSSGTIGVGTNLCDATGNSPQNTPKVTLNMAADYTIDMGAGKVIVGGSFYHNSGFFAEVANRLRQPAYSLFNASLTWKSEDEKYSVRLWGNNLGNKAYASQLVEAENGDNQITAPGRTFGVTVGVDL